MIQYKVSYFVVNKTYSVDSPPHTITVWMDTDNEPEKEEIFNMAEHLLHKRFNPYDQYSFVSISKQNCNDNDKVNV